MKKDQITKRFLCGLITLSMFSIYDTASAYDFSVKNKSDVEIFYNINPDGKTVTVTYGAETYSANEINIPQQVSHKGVTYTVNAIGNRAFEKAKVFTVIIPESVTEIQNYAFNSSSVSTVNYPKGLKTIGENAFSYTNVKNGIFPDGLEDIGADAYWGTPIDSLYLPNSLTALGRRVFYQCKFLRTVKIPGSLKIVNESTFYNCPNLYKVEIEEGVESLGVKPYQGSVFQGCPLTEISIPSSLVYIGPYCFAGNEFTEFKLPNTIQEIGNNCFYNSQQLESITFSNAMKDLPNSVCETCPRLIEAVIPEGIEKIGMSVFSGSSLLSHLALPESVTEVGNGALRNTGLVDFTFPKNLTYISQLMFGSCENLTELTIPETITDIQNSAFSYCTNLKKVTLPATLKTMGNSVFQYCKNLTEVNIPAELGYVPESTFGDCTSLRKMVIPEGITEIGRWAFSSCSNLEELILPKSLEIIHSNIIMQCGSLRSLTIYHNVSVIEQHAFDNCESIEEIHLYRAVLPETPIPLGWLVDRPVINEGNNCTLYVPKGSVNSYKDSYYWNSFKNIEEEEITEELNYQITFPYSPTGGSLTVNGEQTKTVMEFAIGSDVEISITASEGYHLSAFIVNGEDVTDQVIDGVFTINNLDANYAINVVFAENPVMLSIYMATGGSVDVAVAKGETFTCFITPEEDWSINSVTFNGADVTADLTEDNKFTSPRMTADSELRVSFENNNAGIEDGALTATSVKVRVDNNGIVMVEGLELQQSIMLYSLDGVMIDSRVAQNESETFQLEARGIYLIKTALKSYKIQY